MKRIFLFLAFAAMAAFAVACNEPVTPDNPDKPDNPDDPNPPTPVVTLYDINVQLSSEGANFAVEGINVNLIDANGVSYDAATDATGKVTFKVPAGTYTATATYKTAEDGKRIAYNGSNSNFSVSESATSFTIDLNKAVSQQIIIKEFYSTGCPRDNGTDTYSDDAYLILYNNSEYEADASDIVFGISMPSNSHSNSGNPYLKDGKLTFEDLDWMPAQSAIWWFTNPVTIPAYSQIVIAIFGCIDHTTTVTASVDLSNSEYYWMSNTEISTIFKHNKIKSSENIPTSHYLNCQPFGQSTAWLLSNNSPAFFIGKMKQSDVVALCSNSDAFDHTSGAAAVFNAAKFPKANVVDCLDIWKGGNEDASFIRFSPELNTGHVTITTNKGNTAYRNVDKEATEALEENAGKLVYDYSGGTYNAETQSGSTDPSGIDAEASIANGAHIIYSDTNDTAKDFHVRAVSSLKK